MNFTINGKKFGGGVSELSFRDYLTPRAVGFGLDRAWVWSFFLCVAAPITEDAVLSSSFVNLYLISLFFCVFTQALLAIFAGTIGKSGIVDRLPAWSHYLGGIFATIGAVWASISWSFGGMDTFSLMGTALLTGIGSAVVLQQWGTAFCAVPTKQAAVETCVAYLIAAIINFFRFLLPVSAGLLITGPLSLISLVILFKRVQPRAKDVFARDWTGKTTQGLIDGHEIVRSNASNCTTKRETKVFLAKLYVCSLLFGLMVGIMKTVGGIPTTSIEHLYLVSMLAAGLVCVSIILWQIWSPRNFEFSLVYRPVVLILCVGFLIMPFFETTSILPQIISRTGFTCFEILALIALSGTIHRMGAPVVRTYGLGRATSMGGTLIGAIAGLYLSNHMVLNSTVITTIAMIAIFTLFIAQSLVLTEKDLIGIEGWGVFDDYNDGSAFPITVSSARGKIEQYENSSKDLYSLLDDDALALAKASESEMAKTIVSTIQTRCVELAQDYRLSPREVDTLVFLVLGHSRPRIQEELCVSRGTVNTHISHIYQKLNVHGRDEALGLIRSLKVK